MKTRSQHEEISSSQRTVELPGTSSMHRMKRKHRIHLEPQTSTAIEGAARSDFLTCINREFMRCIARCACHVIVRAAQNSLAVLISSRDASSQLSSPRTAGYLVQPVTIAQGAAPARQLTLCVQAALRHPKYSIAPVLDPQRGPSEKNVVPAYKRANTRALGHAAVHADCHVSSIVTTDLQ
jgi:hypothetical protein